MGTKRKNLSFENKCVNFLEKSSHNWGQQNSLQKALALPPWHSWVWIQLCQFPVLRAWARSCFCGPHVRFYKCLQDHCEDQQECVRCAWHAPDIFITVHCCCFHCDWTWKERFRVRVRWLVWFSHSKDIILILQCFQLAEKFYLVVDVLSAVERILKLLGRKKNIMSVGMEIWLEWQHKCQI